MFPSSPPPGVYTTPDESEVTSPLSIAEWLLGFHAAARRTPGCREGICHAGEVLHVPSGWWHLVVNIEDSIAITQNFVPESHLKNVISFMRDKGEQISGFRKEIEDPYTLFLEKLGEKYPESLEKAMDELGKEKGKKRKWEDVVKGKEDQDGSGGGGGGFSFGFGDDSDVEVP